MKPYTPHELVKDMPVMFEAKTAVISDINREKGYIDISDGRFLTGTHINYAKCYPVNKTSLWAADTVRYHKDELYNLDVRGLNWPDINRKLMSYFNEMCEAEGKDAIQAVYDQMVEFCNDVRNLVEKNRSVVVSGVEIFKK